MHDLRKWNRKSSSPRGVLCRYGICFHVHEHCVRLVWSFSAGLYSGVVSYQTQPRNLQNVTRAWAVYRQRGRDPPHLPGLASARNLCSLHNALFGGEEAISLLGITTGHCHDYVIRKWPTNKQTNKNKSQNYERKWNCFMHYNKAPIDCFAPVRFC